ncbi:diguanylate cyclase domain-containing protein [Escherichia coli]
MTGLPNRNNLHNYLDDLVDKAVSPVVYLIGVDHIQDVIDSLGYAWADQALLEVVNRFSEKLKPDRCLWYRKIAVCPREPGKRRQ